MSFREYMEEKRPISRWKVFYAGIVGAFCGALLTFYWMLAALV